MRSLHVGVGVGVGVAVGMVHDYTGLLYRIAVLSTASWVGFHTSEVKGFSWWVGWPRLKCEKE